MPSFEIPYTRCAVPSCTDVPSTWSRYCPRHTQRMQRAGHPTALLPREADFKRHRGRISSVLADLQQAPAVIAAHAEAARLLAFRAPHGATRAALDWQDHMKRLRDWWVEPREVVQRVTEVFFLDQDGQFPDRRACEFTIARMTLRLRRLWGMTMGAPVLAFGGELLHDSFAVFALQLRKQVEDRGEEARERREAMRSGWSLSS
jgi:hypothetical protein